MKLKYIYTCLIFLSILSCQARNEALESALKLAGNNRSELEKVLNHYSQNPTDSLKLKAAEFLIENMPGHYTLEGALINKYRTLIDADTAISYFDQKVLDLSLCQIEKFQHKSHKIEDIQHIKATFLVHHIDLSFKALYSYTWLEDIPFDIFLEYILPYRFGNERLDSWRDSLPIDPNALKEFYHNDIQKYTVSNPETNLVTADEAEVYIRFGLLQKLFKQDIYSDCRHIAFKENFISRVSNFPAAIDYYPHYANRNGFHYWNTIISPEYKRKEVRSFYDRKAAKIFRKTYSRHNTPILNENEYIPEFFLDPFNMDVSNEYMYTADVTICSRKKINKPIYHAYLCVFNNLQWTPVAIGDLKNSKVEFKNMGKNIVYLPIFYQDTKPHSLNYPFILDLKGNTKYLIPDTCIHQKVHIKRKYPFDKNLYYYSTNIKGIIIEAANYKDFHDADMLLSHLEDSITYAQGKITTNKKYKYWRISHPNWSEVSELSFLDSQGNILKGDTDSLHLTAFDKNPLTNIHIRKNNNMIVCFPESTRISKIICIPKGDGNGIYPENEYELFYYAANGWASLGRKTATNYYIEYDNVPKNALLWLRNRTTGEEERIFTIKKGEIRFW